METGFPCGVGEGFDFAVVLVTTAIKDDGSDVGCLGLFSDGLADGDGGGHVGQAVGAFLDRGGEIGRASCRERVCLAV